LQRVQLTQNARITAVPDRCEVMRIEFWKKRIGNPQIRIVHTQARFENLAALADCFEALARRLAAAIIPSQIRERLLAFKNRCRSDRFWMWPISGYVGAISALRQPDFHRASGIAVRLGPEKCETFQPSVPRGFPLRVRYSDTHFASSHAQ
jgi:hypothetical protein